MAHAVSRAHSAALVVFSDAAGPVQKWEPYKRRNCTQPHSTGNAKQQELWIAQFGLHRLLAPALTANGFVSGYRAGASEKLGGWVGTAGAPLGCWCTGPAGWFYF